MSIANDIIYGRVPDLKAYLAQENNLDDIDEYGFTLLIECAIADRLDVAEMLTQAGAPVNQADFSGRTALHWAVYNSNLALAKFLLEHGADANAYTNDGLSILVYPVLRRQEGMKHLLYQHGGKLDFAMDFIHAKLLGHRYALKGDVDILNGKGEFIEIDYEGFILEFTVVLIKDALMRFTSSFSTRDYRHFFHDLYPVIDALENAETLIQLQHFRQLNTQDEAFLESVLQQDLMILPAASRGHAMGFVRYQNWWAKVDRGENAQREGSVNIYHIRHPEQLTLSFLKSFLYQRQPRDFFHKTVPSILGLVPVTTLPIAPQTAGNCSWANMQAIIPAAYYMKQLADAQGSRVSSDEAMDMFDAWVNWDQERALDECLHRFYHASIARKASIAAMLAGVLFQVCDASKPLDLQRAEKILTVLSLPDYQYILNSYLEIYCLKRLTRRGNNLLKLLDDCGFNPGIGVSPIATGLRSQDKSKR
ncbi:MAG: ankyrin repeat domain-containing protein [Gammaproteobacteria bacterium]|nr:ankyrin repeat domain-containing protein [Gammaproteobacteria bacterium]